MTVVQFLNFKEKQYSFMKKLIITSMLLFSLSALNAQNDKAIVLQDLEKDQVPKQQSSVTATLKSASRLFGEKDDLTTVILIIPAGSVVDVIDSDSAYMHVVYDENEGYIFRRHAAINDPSTEPKPVVQKEEVPSKEQATPQQQTARFIYLENKYGTSIAVRIFAGKIWKGMKSEMVRDSWGKPLKVNRVISGNNIKEEWIYKNTWLYIQDDMLNEWGPIK
jgi:hypothetical protein